MAEVKIKSESEVKLEVVLVLSEAEARALHAMTVYGTKSFLEVFYAKLGKDAMQPYEKGISSLFETVKKELPPHLKKMSDIRKMLKEELS